MRTKITLAAVAIATLASTTLAAELKIDSLGDSGWNSLDTRNTSGANLLSPADNVDIATRVNFTTAYDAVQLITTGNSSKASIGVTGSFGSVSQLLDPSFSADYRYRSSGNRISPLKFGIRSTSYASASLPATRTNEDQWDYILVHLPTGPGINTWTTETVTASTGPWGLYKSSIIGGGAVSTSGLTLETLAADSNFAHIFDSAATISTIEFGIGSGQGAHTNELDYAHINFYNGGDTVNFVPEPATLGLLGLGGLLLGRRRRV